MTIGDDEVSPPRVPAGLRVTLFERGELNGRSWVHTADTGLVVHDDMTSSIVAPRGDPSVRPYKVWTRTSSPRGP